MKAVGATTNSTRTPEQTELANFYRSEYPLSRLPEHASGIAKAQTKSIDDSSRLLALVSIAMADTAIMVWDSKKHYNFWRPVTAIHEAENDGNPATAADPAWQPFLTTPPYPDYTSGGNGVTGSTTGILNCTSARTTCPSRSRATSKEAKEKTRNYKSFSEYAKIWSMSASTKGCTSASPMKPVASKERR